MWKETFTLFSWSDFMFEELGSVLLPTKNCSPKDIETYAFLDNLNLKINFKIKYNGSDMKIN